MGIGDSTEEEIRKHLLQWVHYKFIFPSVCSFFQRQYFIFCFYISPQTTPGTLFPNNFSYKSLRRTPLSRAYSIAHPEKHVGAPFHGVLKCGIIIYLNTLFHFWIFQWGVWGKDGLVRGAQGPNSPLTSHCTSAERVIPALHVTLFQKLHEVQDLFSKK